MKRTARRPAGNAMRAWYTRSSSTRQARQPPRSAGTMLSGWPSSRAPRAASSAGASGSPSSAFAATIAAARAAALLPSPRVSGIAFSASMRSDGIGVGGGCEQRRGGLEGGVRVLQAVAGEYADDRGAAQVEAGAGELEEAGDRRRRGGLDEEALLAPEPEVGRHDLRVGHAV